MNIRIKCIRPKYASGEFEFTKFEEVFYWLSNIKGLSKGALGPWLYGLAKRGWINSSTGWHCIEVNSDFHDYFLAREVGSDTGLLKTYWKVSPSRQTALAFVQEFDRRVLTGRAQAVGN